MSNGVEVFEKNHLSAMQNRSTTAAMNSAPNTHSLFLLKLLAAAMALAIIAPAAVLAA